MKKENKKIKFLTGVVEKKSSIQTVKVRVNYRILHPILKKMYTKSRLFLVHDPKNQASLGDNVQIIPGKKLSKNKSWYLISLN